MSGRFDGKSIPDPGFANDDGLADPALISELAAYRSGASDPVRANAALLGQRLFVPVMAILDSTETDDHGHEVEKDSHMGTVSLKRADGQTALLAFTSVESLARCVPEGRPIPARSEDAAAAAIDENSIALIIDRGEEHEFTVELAALIALAEGRSWVPPLRDEEVLSAIRAAISTAEAAEFRFELEPGQPPTDLRLKISPPTEQTPKEAVLAAAQAVAASLSASELLRRRLPGGIELALAPATL